ncbi:MAG: agmatine deiminase family protein [Candidatus Cloacimonetes bacterium]|nr:agmatine deiminase family protein [Candidatus Cloacimonadota bacterium]
MKKLLLILLLIIFSMSLTARIIILESSSQTEHDAVPPPRNLAFPEISEDIFIDGDPISFPRLAPPNPPIRPVSEFEQMSGVLIRYPLGIPLQLVREFSLELRVVTIVANANVRNQAINAFNNANVNMSNVEFVLASSDSYWTRDYGPWFSFSSDGQLNAINFTYNRPRPNDNAFNNHYAVYDTLSIYNMNIVHCGGNYMNDGLNIAFSSHIAYTENGNNSQLVNQNMLEFLGVSEYHVLQDPNATYIDHIDCWAKFLSPDTILLRGVPTSHPQYNALEQVATYLSNQMSAWGRNYNVVRVNTPNNQPYTNSIILNDRVFVPITNTNPNANDLAALQVYTDAMPGYTIIGVPNTTNNPWESTDALHCRAKELAERRIVFIDHFPLSREVVFENEISISANIKSFTGHPLNPDSLNVYYRINQGSFQKSIMTPISGQPDNFAASISGFAPGDSLFYYVRGVDQTGRATNHPYIGAAWAHWTVFTGDAIPPTIVHNEINELSPQQMPILISAQVTDNVGVSYVAFEYFKNEVDGVHIYEMENTTGDVYSLMFDTSLSGVSELFYRIRALDTSNPPNEVFLPLEGWFTVNISHPSLPVIIHTEIADIMPQDMPVAFSARVTSGVGIANVYFEYILNGNTDPISLAMNLLEIDTYVLSLDISLEGVKQIHYRIRAIDTDIPPNESILPIENWFIVNVLGTTGPLIIHQEITQIKPEEMPILFSAQVTDNIGVGAVYFDYFTDLNNDVVTSFMENTELDTYTFLLDIMLVGITEFHYRIRAYDVSYNPIESILPLEGWFIASVTVEGGDIVVVPEPLQVSIYPNPFNLLNENTLKIDVSSYNSDSIRISLYNIRGQRISDENIPINKNVINSLNWDIGRQNLPSGIYFIRFDDYETVLLRRFMILK